MPKLAPLHWQVIDKMLTKLGYEHHRTKGSHRVYVKSGVLMHVTVPTNRNIPVGTISSIIKQMGLTRDQFLEFLDSVKH